MSNEIIEPLRHWRATSPEGEAGALFMFFIASPVGEVPSAARRRGMKGGN